MRTQLLVGFSAVVWVVLPLLTGHTIVAAVFAVGHVLFWQNHVLEVKINKLLDHHGIMVSQKDITS